MRRVCYASCGMKNFELTEDAARRGGVEQAVAADRLDRAVNGILKSLRSGKPARLPGLGTIMPGKRWKFRPESHGR